jgi:rRNA maturation RNase YbeY
VSTSDTFSISKTTRGKVPTLPFALMKDHALGSSYDLSLVFIGSTLSRRLNRERCGKDAPTNILSFTLSKSSGEIFIDLALAKKQCKKFDRTFSNFVGFLFIHGLFHLKGFDHGSTMEKAEEKTRKQFSI